MTELSHPMAGCRLQVTTALQRTVRACIYAALLCAFAGAFSDAQAQLGSGQLCSALDMSSADCARIGTPSTTLPAGLVLPNRNGTPVPTNIPWLVSPIANQGVSSLRSGRINSNQASCLVVEVSLPARTRIRFSLRTDSEGRFDRLAFAADNQILIESFSAPSGSEIRDWEQQEFILSGSISNLSWCYLKDNFDANGADSGWLDTLSFTFPPDIPDQPLTRDTICQALDMSADDCALLNGTPTTTRPAGLVLPNLATGPRPIPNDVQWVVTTETSVTGGSSMRSGNIDRDQASCLVVAVSLPARTQIRFSLRTDSEGRFDRLAFFADTQILIENFSAPRDSEFRDWVQQEFLFSNSVSNLTWCYLKDSSDDRGEDSGWLDTLSFTARQDLPLSIELICLALDMSSDDCALVTSSPTTTLPAGLVLPTENGTSIPTDVPWFVSSIANQGDTSMRSDNIDHNQASCLVMPVSLPARIQIRFSLRTNSEGQFDRLAFAADNQILIENFSAPRSSEFRDWEPQEFFPTNSISNLTWCFLKDLSFSAGADSGWLDTLSFTALQDLPLTIELICQALNLATAECALITYITSTPPESPWFVSPVATEGDISLRSGDIADNQQSCLILEVSQPRRTLVQFSRRVSSQPGGDELVFAADDQRQNHHLRPAATTVLRDWSREPYTFLQAGFSTLSWCYSKDGDTSEGEDSAWIDDLTITPTAAALINRELACLVLDLSLEDCSRITSVAADPPALPWFISTISRQGGTALRSGSDTGDNQTSCLVLEISLPASSQIRFSLRSDTEGANDFLYFEADGIRLIDNFSAAQGASLRAFEQLEFFIASSISNLRWCYTKNGSTSEGADSGWLDRVSFNDIADPAAIPLSRGSVCQALDLAAAECALITYITSTPPESPWFVSPVATEGDISLRSGDTADNQQSCLILEVSQPRRTLVQFSRRVSSQPGGDELFFAADDQRQNHHLRPAATTVLRDWSREPYTFLQAGFSTLSWCYSKDGDTSEGEDSAWIDDLTITPTAAALINRELACLVLDLSLEDCSRITSVASDPPALPWFISTVSRQGGTSLRSGRDTGDNQTSCLVLGISLPASSQIRFSLRSDAEGTNDFAYFEADGIRLIDNFSAAEGASLRGFEQLEFFVASSISNLRWCFTKNDSTSEGEDSTWLDRVSFADIADPADIPLSRGSICQALDMTAAECALISNVASTPPESPWFFSPVATEGDLSLRSGDIADNQQSCLILEVSQPRRTLVQFSRRVSSQPGGDELVFAADDQRQNYPLRPAATTVLRDWSREPYTFLQAGFSTLSWCYSKDGDTSEGEDSAWIDDLTIIPTAAALINRELACLVLDMSPEDCSRITRVAADPPALPWFISTISKQGGTALRSGRDTGDNQTSCLVLEISLPANSQVRFSLRSDTEGANDFLYFEADGIRLIDNFSAAQGASLRAFEQLELLVSSDISNLRWCYTKNSSTSVGADSGWLDTLSFEIIDVLPLCDTLDLPQPQCATIRSFTYDPPQNPWLTTTTEFIGGTSALVSPPLETGQSACLTLDIDSTPPAGSYLTFAWRVTSASALDILEFRAGSQQRQLRNMPQWQTEVVTLNGSESTLSWCYRFNSPADGQAARAWLDSLLTVSPDDRYVVQIAVTETPVILSPVPDRLRFQVTVTAQSTLLSTPTDWVLRATGSDNIASAATTHALVFSDGSAQIDVIASRIDPFLPSTMRLELDDRPLLRGVTVTSLTYQLPPRQLDRLDIVVVDTVTQASPDAAIEIAVTVNALDNLGLAIDPQGLILMVAASGSASVPQSSYALAFMDGTAQTTVTVELTARGMPGSIEVSVIGGSIESTARITLNPTPRVLVSINLSAPNSSLAQTMANTAVMAELILTALDNYGDPIEAGNITLLLSGSGGATGQSSLIVPIEAGGSAQQMIEILPQNDLDTTVTVQLSRGNLDEAVQLLPEGGVQIAVRALRVLRQLQLSLADRVSPLQQIDSSVPITARVQLIGLDQFDQPIAFPEVMLTATADPSTTQVTLNPQLLTATAPAGVITVLEVTFSATPLNTTITITIANPGTGVAMNNLVLRALPELRPPLPSLNVDNADPSVTELDLVVALRWLTNQQDSTQSLVVNLTLTSTSVITAGIENLQQLFNADSDRVDINRDGRADQLDLRILLRYMSGLRGTQLAEQEISVELIRLLLGKPANIP